MKVQFVVTLDVQPGDDGNKVPRPGEPGWGELVQFLQKRILATLQDDAENDTREDWDDLLEANAVDAVYVSGQAAIDPEPRGKRRK